jgi:hypothetical protein
VADRPTWPRRGELCSDGASVSATTHGVNNRRRESHRNHDGDAYGRKRVLVCQFFVTGDYEFVRRWVGLREAVEAAKHYTNSIAARAGIVTKVILLMPATTQISCGNTAEGSSIRSVALMGNFTNRP